MASEPISRPRRQRLPRARGDPAWDWHDIGAWRFFVLREYGPYPLLAVATLLSQLTPHQTLHERLVVLGLAALGAAWMLVLFTLPPRAWRQRPGTMLVYFSGLLLVGALLEAHSTSFLVFVVAGYVQAFAVLPSGPQAVLGVAATTCVFYLGSPAFKWQFPDALPLVVLLIGFQTITVSGANVLVARNMQESEKRRRLRAELDAAQEQNAGLQVQVLTQAREAGILEERKRMAREIHDTLAQGLTGIITQLEAAEQARLEPEVWLRHVDQARALARENLTEARRSVQALRPEPLEGSHLPEAIGEAARRWAETTAVAVQVETTGQPLPLLPELEITLYRVTQEALTNVAKHARASRVGVTLSYLDDEVLLDVRDDGVGFTPTPEALGSTVPGHRVGLQAMEQRLRRVGGRLEIESAPGAGTAINARVPAIPAEGGV